LLIAFRPLGDEQQSSVDKPVSNTQ
jgi:hypothetical protein